MPGSGTPARLLDPPGERSQGHRVSVEAMTLRSDSPIPVQQGVAWFFFGLHQDNIQRIPPDVVGLSRDSKVVYVRGRDHEGRRRSTRDVIGTLMPWRRGRIPTFGMPVERPLDLWAT
jgi:hypothetical protein